MIISCPSFLRLSFILLLAGCSTNIELAGSKNWKTESPIDRFIDATEKDMILPPDINLVSASKLAEAEQMLDRKACVEIQASKAAELLNHNVLERAGFKLFLVRGICQNRETGNFQCMLFRHDLKVFFGAMGSSFGPIEKQPIILWLREQPKRVFVTCSVMK